MEKIDFVIPWVDGSDPGLERRISALQSDKGDGCRREQISGLE